MYKCRKFPGKVFSENGMFGLWILDVPGKVFARNVILYLGIWGVPGKVFACNGMFGV